MLPTGGLVSREIDYMPLNMIEGEKKKQLEVITSCFRCSPIPPCTCMQFTVNDVTFYDIMYMYDMYIYMYMYMWIPRHGDKRMVHVRPFLPIWVGGAGAQDYWRAISLLH